MNTPVLPSLNAVLVPLVKFVAMVNPPMVPVFAVMSPVILAALAVKAPTGLTKNALEDVMDPLLFRVTFPPISLFELIDQPPMVPVLAVISPVILAKLAVKAPTGLTKKLFEDVMLPSAFREMFPPVSLFDVTLQPPMVPVLAVMSPVILAALAVT